MQASTDEMRNYSLQEFKHNDLLSKKKNNIEGYGKKTQTLILD